jgi:hypothetical protein
VGITFSRLSASYWIDNLGFLLREKLAAIFITTCSWGFPTGRSFTSLISPTITAPSTSFSRAVAGEEEDFCEGSFRTHILYFVLSFALLYFYLNCFIKNPKKFRILGSCYFFTISHYVVS